MRFFVATMLVLTLGTRVVGADEWPQWMGPDRDNTWKEDGILQTFPEEGPKVLWSTECAGGYAGPAVAGGKVYLTDYVTSDDVKVDNFGRVEFNGEERVLCLDETNGEVVWSHSYPVKYSISYPSGPRCTPLIEDDRVYTLGAEGNLICFQATSGDIIWERNLPSEYNTKSALWGYAAHPLIDGDKLLCLAGGEGSHIVALNKMTGAEIWRSSTSPEQGYSPPTIIEAGGERQLLLLRPDAVSSVDVDTGEEFWSVEYEATSGSIIMSPVTVGNYLYVAGYSNKSLLLELAEDEPSVSIVWRDRRRDAISPVNVQPIVVGDVVYGFDQGGTLNALKLPEGDRLWSTTKPIDGERALGSATAFIVKQDDRFWLFNELGDLIIAKMTPEGYEEIDRANVIEPSNLAFGRNVVWSQPAFANRRAYIRNDDKIICLDLSE